MVIPADRVPGLTEKEVRITVDSLPVPNRQTLILEEGWAKGARPSF